MDLTQSKPYDFDIFGGFNVSAGSLLTTSLNINAIYSLKFLWTSYVSPDSLTVLRSSMGVILMPRGTFQMLNILQEVISRSRDNLQNTPPLSISLDGHPPTKEEEENYTLDEHYYWMIQLLINFTRCPGVDIEDECVEEADADWRERIIMLQSVVSNLEFTGEDDTTEGAHNGENVHLLKTRMKLFEIDVTNTFGRYVLGAGRVTQLNLFLDKYNIYLKIIMFVAYVLCFTALSESISPYWCLMMLFQIPGSLASIHSCNIAIAQLLIRNFTFWYCQLQCMIFCISGIILVQERGGSGFLIFGFIMMTIPICLMYFSDGGPPRFIICYTTYIYIIYVYIYIFIYIYIYIYIYINI